MLPYNQIGIIANREITDVGTSDKTFFFNKTFGKFLDFFSYCKLYIYIILGKICPFFNIKRLKKKYKTKQTLGCTWD